VAAVVGGWVVVAVWGAVWAADGVGEGRREEGVALPAARQSGGRPLLEALRERRSVRDFAARELPESLLADLVWAAFGVNRAETGRRTAPSTMDLRALDVYVVTSRGAWRYDAARHARVAAGVGDLRRLTGGQEYVAVAPVALVYVADERRMERVPEAERAFYAAADAGFVGQNVYLFCASEGLGSVVHMPGDRARLASALGLAPEQKIVLVHAVGYPAGAEAVR
jgi:nitroreductase